MGDPPQDRKRADEAEPGDVSRMRAGDLAALEPDAAAGRRQEVGQEIEAGRLAGAVGADERVDRAPAYPQPHALHREEAAKLLGEVLGLQDEVVGQQARGRGGKKRASRFSCHARLASSISHDASHSCCALSTSSSCSRGARGNEAWSRGLVWALAVGDAARALPTMSATVPSRSARAQTRLTRPMARASAGLTFSFSRASSLARPPPTAGAGPS